MNVEKILDFLANAWDFVCAFAMEIFFTLAGCAIAAFFIMIFMLAYTQDNEREARLEYCYQQGYVEVIESQYKPQYYCFDARRNEESMPIASIPDQVWKSNP
jgi:hypothetical protein